jgi:hypothetical protein
MPIALGVLFVGAAIAIIAALAERAAGGSLGSSSSTGATGSSSSSSDTTTSSSATGVSATAASIMQHLTSNGLSKIAAAGVVGNLQQESGLDPSAPGGGLAQWQAPRGPSDWSLSGQLTYLVNDLRSNYSGLLAQMNRASSPAQAATMFSDQYERPGTPMLQNRINYANAAYGAS